MITHWSYISFALNHWGWVTHICVSKLNIIGSDNGLSPGRRQAIIWTNSGILLIRTLGTNFSEILSEIHAFSLKKMHLKMSSAKWRYLCLGLNVLSHRWHVFMGFMITTTSPRGQPILSLLTLYPSRFKVQWNPSAGGMWCFEWVPWPSKICYPPCPIMTG